MVNTLNNREFTNNMTEETKKPTTKHELKGSIDELGSHVCTCGGDGQQMTCVEMTEAIGDCVGGVCGKPMMVLVKNGTKAVFEEPTAPSGETISQVKVKKCKIELKKHCDKVEKCDNDEVKVFVIVKGQCTSAMKNKVESVEKCSEWEDNNDVVNSLKGLKEPSHSTVEARCKHWTLCET